MSFPIVQDLVLATIVNSKFSDWTVQGFGMLRLHLPNDYRIHIWDSKLKVPNVSDIHDHLQWGLRSTVISGRIINNLFQMVPGDTHEYLVLKPGFGTKLKTDPQPCKLVPIAEEIIVPGHSYAQQPNEIHQTDFRDGTITLMKKFPTKDESARVFWEKGNHWVSAEPRKASEDEFREAIGKAKAIWNHAESRWP